MKRFLQRRVLPLLCCLSLTVGLFSYQPPKAKAVAVADDLLITGVILAVMGYDFHQQYGYPAFVGYPAAALGKVQFQKRNVS